MKVDSSLNSDVRYAEASAHELEVLGFSAGGSHELAHDPFLPLVTAARGSESLQLGTSIAVAFARNPMLLANIGWDLQAYSRGRFILGLGSQIRAHITRRFSMPWSHPAARMRELIAATRAIWDCWLNDGQLEFKGDFYQHTLMTPYFTPAAADIAAWGVPKIFLAGVGELMTEVAGEVGDGFIAHGFTTERYLREVTLPALLRGRERVGKSLEGFEIVVPSFVVTGSSEEQMERQRASVREQVGFYGSTPAYRAVLELHGWGDLQTELRDRSRSGDWQGMGLAVPEDVLDAFAIVAEPTDLAAAYARRFRGVATRLTIERSVLTNEAELADVVTSLGAV